MKKSELREMIKEELKEAYVDSEDIHYAMETLVEDLQEGAKKINMDKAIAWAEKYPRSFSGLQDIVNRLVKTIAKWK